MVIQYNLSVVAFEGECSAWKLTFAVSSDDMAKKFAENTLIAEHNRWIGVKFELHRVDDEHTFVANLHVVNHLSVVSWNG